MLAASPAHNVIKIRENERTDTRPLPNTLSTMQAASELTRTEKIANWANRILDCESSCESRGKNAAYTIWYEMLFNVRSQADIDQLNEPHGNEN